MSKTNSRIYLSSPHMGGEELDYIHDAFDKNWIAPLGENVNGFEKDLQAYTGRSHATVLTSGTAAIHLALILCGVKPGDEVLCQSFTFAATANPVRYQGATPVFIDSEPDTWNMDPELLEKAIRDRLNGGEDSRKGAKTQGKAGGGDLPGETDQNKESSATIRQAKSQMPKAIVVVHLYGMPAKMDRILEIGEKYGIPVIEDAAEALGSTVNARKCGSFGKFSVLSFNGNKIITTSGGGALLSEDEELIQKARFLSTQARDDAPHYQHSELGYNYRMSNIVAGIGRGQMKVLDERVALRRANHDYYVESLGGSWFGSDKGKSKSIKAEWGHSALSFELSASSSPTGIYFLKEPDGFKSNRWLTTVLVNPEETGGVTREDIRLALEKENIESRPLWKPMHLQPLYEDCPFYGRGVSDRLFEYGLCLPSGSNLGEEDRDRVVTCIKKLLMKPW